MAKLISKNTKRNVFRVRERLERETVTIKIIGKSDQTMLAGEALLLGSQLLMERKEQQALQFAIQLSENFSDIVDVQLLKVRALIQLEELVDAQQVLDMLLKTAPNNIGVLAAAVGFNIILGDIEAALKSLRLSNRLRPDSIETLLRLAECYRLTGEYERAKKIVERCLHIAERKKTKSDKGAQQYFTVLLRLANLTDVYATQRNELEVILGSKQAEFEMRSEIAFAFAKQASGRKPLDEEVKYLDMANKFQAKSMEYFDTTSQFLAQLQKHVQVQQEIFSSPHSNWLTGFHSNSEIAPIFILGMPRSGTTLIEQVLGAHSKVGQTGESKALSIGVTRAYAKHQPGYSLADYPMRFDKIPHNTLHEIARYYEEHQKLLTDKMVYIDKELSTFKFVGLLTHLFPKAKFIHMNRAPLDIFLSCYRGSIPGIPATCNLEHLAIYYVYMKKIIGYWKKIYPDKVYILDYAELVDAPEAKIQEVFKFLSLDYEPEVLAFHKRKNVVRTLSVDQVRQSIYKTAVKKWLPFAEMLEPAKKILEMHGVDEEGVSVL